MDNSFRKTVTRKYRSILRQWINMTNRNNLKNYDFSIISSNCTGGIIYHDLGLKFASPTINLFFKAPDYIKFISNINFYLNQELLEDKSNSLNYPVGILKDIKLYFLHYKDFNEAKTKWIQRTKRLNFKKIFVIMLERDECTYKEIKEFDELPYENKIIFVKKPMLEIKSAVYLKGTVGDNSVIDITQYVNRFTGKRYLDQFDFVNWLNGETKNKI